MSDNYLLTKTQLKALLAGSGVTRIVGFDPGSGPVTAEQLPNAYNALMRLSLISSDGERFYASEQAKSIIRQLTGAPAFFAVHTRRANLPDMCVYCGEKLLTVAFSPFNADTVSIGIVSFDIFFQSLEDEGYFPEEFGMALVGEEMLEEYERVVFSAHKPECPLRDDSRISFCADLIGADGSNLGCVRVVEYTLFRYLYFSGGGVTERCEYSAEMLKKYLKRLFEKNDFG